MDIRDNPNSGYRPKSLVKLNVGGKMFMTTQGTLLSNGSLICSKIVFPDKNGKFQFDIDAYFIDRCPKYFGIILNFLRSGLLEKVANIDLNFLRSEAGYFGIQELVKIVNEEIGKQIERNSRNDREQKSPSKNCLNCQNYRDFPARDLVGQDFTSPYIDSPNLVHRDIASQDSTGQGEGMKEKENTKAVTYDERPKMKRDSRQKSSPFPRKRLLFCQIYLFIFGHS